MFGNATLMLAEGGPGWITFVFCLVLSLAVGSVAAWLWFQAKMRNLHGSHQRELAQEHEQLEQQRREILNKADVESQKKFLDMMNRFERETAETRDELKSVEKRLSKREDVLDKKLDVLGTKERKIEESEQRLAKAEKDVAAKEAKFEELIGDTRKELLRISKLTSDEAKSLCLKQIEHEVEREAGQLVEKILTTAQENAREKARHITIEAIQRYAAEHTCETTIATVDVASDDMKGRIIGREGRNIRAFEKTTGVTVIVDDTPGVVSLSCFDPIRKEIARLSLERLIKDGRIHPSRIEELVKSTAQEIEEKVDEVGKQAALETNVNGLHKKIISLLGRLHYRTSYGQNVLRHAIEVSFLCGVMADELGLDGNLARRCGLLHDIGKALDHEAEGTHTKIGAEFCKRHGEPPAVLNAIGGHHGDIAATHPYTPLVTAADAISASRPGGRRESLERYIKRLEELETIATSYEGVTQAYAVEAGREVRVIVDVNQVEDRSALKLARDIANKIEETVSFPGEIKITVLRELRAVEYARQRGGALESVGSIPSTETRLPSPARRAIKSHTLGCRLKVNGDISGSGASDAPRMALRGRAFPYDFSVWLLTFLVALTLYTCTANRGPQAQDSGWQQLRIVTGQLEHPLGLPLYHPVHYYLGRLAIHLTNAEPAFAITLVSSTAAAVAIANISLVMFVLTRRRLVATLIATCAFMLSHTFWQHATYTESYALSAAFLSGEWLCLAFYVSRRRPRLLVLLPLLNGLGIATHLLGMLATPVDMIVLWHACRRRRISIQAVALGAALWIVGTLPYSIPVIQLLLKTGDFPGTIRATLFGRYQSEILNVHLGSRMLLLMAGYFVYNFPGLTMPLAAYGLTARKTLPRLIKRILAAELILYATFAMRYAVADQYTFYFPVYMALTVLAGAGLARLGRHGPPGRRRTLLIVAAVTAVWTPLVYIGTAKAMSRTGALTSMVKNKPYRDGYRAFFIPWGRGADAISRVIETARSLAGADGIILVQDRMQLFPIQYAQAVGTLPATVTILDVGAQPTEETFIERRAMIEHGLAAGRAVVLIPLDRDKPSMEYLHAIWERVGDLYRLTGLESATGFRSP